VKFRADIHTSYQRGLRDVGPAGAKCYPRLSIFISQKHLRGARLHDPEDAPSLLPLDRSLYSDLCREAYAATREFLCAHFPSIEDAVPAMVISPQSFGSLLNAHPQWEVDREHEDGPNG
jgi:hypothetical protein